MCICVITYMPIPNFLYFMCTNVIMVFITVYQKLKFSSISYVKLTKIKHN